MKNGILLLLCFLLLGCGSKEYINNQEVIKFIDSLDFSKTEIELRTYVDGNIKDTISVERYKYDRDSIIRFKEIRSRFGTSKLRQYLTKKEDVFYEEQIYAGNRSDYTFETFRKKEDFIEKAILEHKDVDSILSIPMVYDYEFRFNGKRESLTITTKHPDKGVTISETYYSDIGKPASKMISNNGDTLSYTHWKYVDSLLTKTTEIFYQRDTIKVICYFGENEKLIQENRMEYNNGKFNEWIERKYLYDEKNHKSKSISENLNTGEKTYYKYVTLNY